MSEVTSVLDKVSYAIPCGVCGDPISLNEWEVRHTTFRLCPECIKAIKWAKIQMKSANMNIVEDDGK